MEEKHRIQITIADRSYPFSVAPDQEEIMRLAVKRISERMDNYKKKFALRDNQDALAITALMFVAQMIKEKRTDTSGSLVKELQYLSDQLDEYFENNITK